jgi:trimethylamine--corrinoid protein Co-methyltransferase
MSLLAKTGLRLLDPQAVEIFKAHGVRTDGELVFPDEAFLLARLAQAPQSFVLEARNPAHDLALGGGERFWAAAYGCPAVVEADGRRRSSTLADCVKLARLVQASPCFKINGGILAQPNELPPALAAPAMVYAALRQSDKALFLVSSDAKQFSQILELAAVPWGGLDALAQAPRALTLISSLSPLQFDRRALESLRLSAAAGQAVSVSPGPMAGTTGPLTLAGNLALGNAECLVGLALAQLVRPGAPVIYGLEATATDLASGGVCVGGASSPVQTGAAKALAAFYGLPCRSGGALTDAKTVSAQSGWESAVNLLAGAFWGVDLVIHAAGVLDAWAALSYEKFILDLELIDLIEKALAPLEVDEAALAVELAAEVGPGGTFLTRRETARQARSAPWLSRLAQRGPRDTGPTAEHLAAAVRREEQRLLDAWRAPELAPEAVRDLEAVMRRLGADRALLDSVVMT